MTRVSKRREFGVTKAGTKGIRQMERVVGLVLGIRSKGLKVRMVLPRERYRVYQEATPNVVVQDSWVSGQLTNGIGGEIPGLVVSRVVGREGQGCVKESMMAGVPTVGLKDMGATYTMEREDIGLSSLRVRRMLLSHSTEVVKQDETKEG